MPDTPQQVISAFQRAIDVRRRQEEELSRQSGPEGGPIAGLLDQLKDAEDRRAAHLAGLQARFDEETAAARDACDSRLQRIEAEAADGVRECTRRIEAEAADVEQRRADSAWVVTSLLDDEAEDSPRRQYDRFRHASERTRDEQASSSTSAMKAMAADAERFGWTMREVHVDPPQARTAEQASAAFTEEISAAEGCSREIAAAWLPRLLMGWRMSWTWLLLSAAAAVPILLLVDPAIASIRDGRWSGLWLAASAAAGAAAGTIIALLVYTLAALKRSDIFWRWREHLARAEALAGHWEQLTAPVLERKTKEFEQLQAARESQRAASLAKFEQATSQRLADLQSERTAELAQLERRRRDDSTAALAAREDRLEALTQELESRRSELITRSDAELDALKSQVSQQRVARQREQFRIWSSLKTGWDSACTVLLQSAAEAQSASRAESLPWNELLAGGPQPAKEIPSGVRLGEFQIDLHAWPGAVSGDMRLAPRSSQLSLPAVLPFPGRPSLLLRSRTAEGRAAALPVLQSAMLRLLTLLPPGTIRFTLLDPVAMGESFAGFMHLADVDELLVTSRIWTEPGQIEARLAELTEHMENVLQTYLRNEFPSLEAYNAHAGEVAEPYRILVVRDFPAKFSEIAARRLTSIITSGPRCGVYTLLALDERLDLPNNFHLSEIEPQLNVFEHRAPRPVREEDRSWIAGEETRPAGAEPPPQDIGPPAFYSTEPSLAPFPLQPEEPPSPDAFAQIVKRMATLSRGARRVEVAFERIAPAATERWTGDSRSGLDVPMGRAGAVKLQHVRLGQGTSQHMLVAGKTGSGKSTFLHGLITNLALHYSPEELQFFLIDFKKGVEFKDYAEHHLPHARVIAIESDREFGVSALLRLEELLQERGELFRKCGVQDIAGYRHVRPGEPLPRIMLVIDEFQEFFVEDDRYAQAAALHLDRLVRQGRAFGVHVVLGSQTLGGAYSLARSTLGQMAVRVALQCSEADAHLILSEDNTAARLLSRPGEAIYNDANGLVEGNHPFQIAWLPDAQREACLRDMAALARSRCMTLPAPVVFEGNIPSPLDRQPELAHWLASVDQDFVPATSPKLWWGDAVEIGAPTSSRLERRAGCNVMLAGQDAEAVQGLFSAAMLATVSQCAPAPQTESPSDTATGTAPGETPENAAAPMLYLFDGSAADDPARNLWRRMAEGLGPRLRIVPESRAADALAELDAERRHRDADRGRIHPPVLMLVYGLSRFRDLRKRDDDFSYSGFGGAGNDKPASPARQFTDLLADGPELGLHVVAWADSYTTVERWLSRQALRDFELRVLFPMNAGDSSNLMDSPLASKLGANRALLYREERGSAEKFRPYAAPAEELLDAVARRLRPPAPAEVATDLGEFQIA